MPLPGGGAEAADDGCGIGRRLGKGKALAGGEPVHRQLEVLAVGVWRVLADLVVVLLLSGLEVGDDQSTADGPVDTVNTPSEPE